MSGIKTQGQLHEDAALKAISGDAYNLNGEAARGMEGNQFPTYDICSSTELASVKSHISQPGQCPPADIAAYKADFSHMLGWGRGMKGGLEPLQQDAERISNLSAQGFVVPSEIKGASPEQTASYLQNNTIMRIPDDHVVPVRQSMEQDIRSLPENYFLPANPTDEQVQGVLNRIQGTDLTSSQTIERMNAQDQAAQQDGAMGADLAVEAASQAVPEAAVAEELVNSEEVQQVEAAAEDQAGIKSVATDTSQPDQALRQEDNPAYEASPSPEESTTESDGYQYGQGY